MKVFFCYLCKTYIVALAFGFILYFFFPESEELWLWLEKNHVEFAGDPHIGRFVSVYFDPNYYACIAGLMFLVGSYLYSTTKQARYLIFSMLCLLSGFLSWSRSGMALLGALLLYQGWKTIVNPTFSRKRIYITGICILFSTLYIAMHQEESKLFLERIFHFFEDESALCRFKTFQFGLDLLAEYPFFGVGINFLHRYTLEGMGLNSLDSSLLSLLVQIGIVPFSCLSAYAMYKALIFRSYNRVWREREPACPRFLSLFYAYSIFTTLFASQFNNILFYPFWLLPFGVVFLFLISQCKRQALEELALENKDITCKRFGLS